MRLTAKQETARQLLSGDATHFLLAGGSRSGKTYLIVRQVCLRALKAPGSRHAVFRFRMNHVIASVFMDTFPKVMAECFPGVKYTPDKSHWLAKFENGAEIWFGGLDDKERTEKILGLGLVTAFLNECSQIPQGSRDMVTTRLAQKVDQVIDNKPSPLKTRMYYDCNPPPKSHWTYKLFVQKVDPETKRPLTSPEDYGYFQINPEDNLENLPEGYLKTLEALPARMQKRFLRGEFADATPNQLFKEEDIDKWRVIDGVVPDLVRIVVAIDPSGSGDVDNADRDAIGIVVAGVGTDGNGYVLEDLTVKAGPATWGQVATSAFDRHAADTIVGEVNYGGEMVRHVIQTARPRTPYRAVTATRGKVVRAEPISALYEAGKVRHVGQFRELEDELAGFSTFGYTGQGSPNRADALIWALSELFPGMVKPAKKETTKAAHVFAGEPSVAWMGG